MKPKGALWRHADFMKLWTGQSVSEFGTAVTQLALPLVALYKLRASAFEVAALETIQFLPFILFTLPAGVWVDRLPRRLVLIVGDFGRALLLATIPITYIAHALTLAQLYAVAFLVGIHTVFFDVAYQSYLPALVEREHLIEGNSKLQVTVSGAQIAGPGLAGVLVGAIGAPFAIVVDAASFVVSGGFTAAIRKREQREPGAVKPRMRSELWEGLRYVLTHRLLLPQAMSTGTSNFFSSMTFAIFVVYMVRYLHLSPALIGLATMGGGMGWLLGSLTATRVGTRLGVGAASIFGSVLGQLAMWLFPLAPRSFPLPLLILGGIGTGAGAVIYNIQQVSLRQAITPERLQGRMNASMRFVVWGTMPLGSLTGGALASTIGLRETLFAGAAGGLLAVLPLVFSDIRKLAAFPEPEDQVTALEAEGEGSLIAPTPAHAAPDA